jgi:hypothetical protein
MVSTARCRELLGEVGRDLSDAEVEAVRDQLQILAGVVLSGAEESVRAEARARADSWSHLPAEDVADLHERSAVYEYDSGLSRDAAERRAGRVARVGDDVGASVEAPTDARVLGRGSTDDLDRIAAGRGRVRLPRHRHKSGVFDDDGL